MICLNMGIKKKNWLIDFQIKLNNVIELGFLSVQYCLISSFSDGDIFLTVEYIQMVVIQQNRQRETF